MVRRCAHYSWEIILAKHYAGPVVGEGEDQTRNRNTLREGASVLHNNLIGLTIFAGAFLLFQVQMLIGNYILPWFCGAPRVWMRCPLFFPSFPFGGHAH